MRSRWLWTLAAAAALAACQPQDPGAPTGLDETARAFVRDAAIANLYATRCGDRGIALRDGTAEAMSAAFVARMRAAGHSAAAIEAALTSVDPAALSGEVEAYLADRGASLDAAPGILCPVARDEALAGTGPGALLAVGA